MIENSLRTIGYLLLFAINVLLFVFLHSHFHFVVILIMAIAPVLFAIANLILIRCLDISVKNMAGNNITSKQNELSYVLIDICNKTPFVCLDAKLTICFENPFMQTQVEKIISVPIRAFKGYQLKLPLVASYPGRIKVSVTKIKAKDLMGITYLNKDMHSSGEYIILPEYIAGLQYQADNMEQGILESDESTKKGNDFSDVSDIREYIPGDKLMSIHWKLSAKRDILMVKDRSSMSDRQIVVLVELCNENRFLLSRILSVSYSLIRKIIEDNTTVRLMYYSISSGEYHDITIDNKENLDNAYSQMLYEKVYASYDEASMHMASVYPEIKAYLHVTAGSHGVVVDVKENV